MIIIPYSSEVLVEKRPIGNILIIAICVLLFGLTHGGIVTEEILHAMALSGWHPGGLFTHQFFHLGFFHLGFNMLYLWVFGNTVCAKIGNVTHVGVFLLCGILAATMHNLLSGGMALGASGAINGILGFYLVIHPLNRISCFWVLPMIFMFRWGTFEATGFWLIIVWFLIDAFMALSGIAAGVAYWGHVGGFVGGLALGFLFLKFNLVELSQYDNPTLLDYFKGKPRTAPMGSAGAVAPDAAGDLARSMIVRRKDSTPYPAASSGTLQTSCPHCRQSVNLPTHRIGQPSACPNCGGAFVAEDA